jgi:YD repeat-containing protein
MVDVFTGTGLGLFNSSLTQLGGVSGGSGGVGQSGERQYVNLATGNLVLQDIDESILTRGLPIGFVRTYNSRGLVTESGRQVQVGQDGWLNVFERRVSGLTGTVNTAGSTVKRTLGDGSEVVFAWDASRSAYVSTVGEGAHDTITWNASNSRWTWTEGATRDQEVYDASGSNGGRLLTILNAKSGAQYDVSYTAAGPTGLVSTVYSSLTTGDGLSFTYTSGRLTRVSTREGGTIVGQADYAYDNLDRLISVTTDLTPQITTDNAWSGTASSNDGRLFRTTYAYESLTDANNLRIASVTHSDGTLVSYGYDGSGRVIRATVGDSNGNDADCLGQTTAYAYGTTSGGLTPVTVTDASGRAWVYRFDATTSDDQRAEADRFAGGRRRGRCDRPCLPTRPAISPRSRPRAARRRSRR